MLNDALHKTCAPTNIRSQGTVSCVHRHQEQGPPLAKVEGGHMVIAQFFKVGSENCHLLAKSQKCRFLIQKTSQNNQFEEK